MPDNDTALREQLFQLLCGANAHVDVLTALSDFPEQHYGSKPANASHSAWELLEHLRIALHDLWDFSTDSDYQEMKWPEDYWPASAQPPNSAAWHSSVKAIEEDLAAFGELARNPSSNLYAEIPWGKNKQTLLRSILVAADHNSYHTGELVLLRRMLGIWKV